MDKKKILVVDDDAAVLEMLKGGLEILGYSVTTSDKPSAIQSEITQVSPDVILLDVNMPGIDGISLCRDIRCTPATKDIPIIMITALDDEKTFHDAMLFGATDFVTKPFEIEEVNGKIKKSLARSEAKRGKKP